MDDMKKIFLLFVSLLIMTGCSKKSEQGYIETAKKNIDENKIAEAIVNYETLIKDYPESQLAPEAMYQMGSLYQNKRVPNLKENESFLKAVQIYKNIHEKYSKSKQAVSALFMAGFIQANDLRNYDEATATYNLFLQKYPNSELVTAVKDELENMGLSPDQILKKKEIPSK